MCAHHGISIEVIKVIFCICATPLHYALPYHAFLDATNLPTIASKNKCLDNIDGKRRLYDDDGSNEYVEDLSQIEHIYIL